jgi:hypothetical protein
MIRNLMLAAGLFTLTTASAFAAPAHQVARTTSHVAKAEDAPPAADTGKKAKKAKKSKKAKDDKAAEPAPAPAPAK